MKKISSSILLSSRSCWVLWGRGPPGVSMVRLTDLGAVWAGLCCNALALWVVVLHCSGAETGLKISNNSTREKSNLKKKKNFRLGFSPPPLFFCFFSLHSLFQRLNWHRLHLWALYRGNTLNELSHCGFIVAEECTQKACQLHSA